ncbi:uncharacterized protein LOC116604856 [Nematostella vectensis]|uniref:uncharacterized protein LOC116604856 n=1 Tax=Nematostella vectensis TaxID=45351 RepID=UPI0020775B26|nr:uncharacterized protein LOC116604856 [Nematostella vectensis]
MKSWFAIFTAAFSFAFTGAVFRSEDKNDGNYKRFEGKRLNESIIAIQNVDDNIDCALLCTEHPQCLSFNFKSPDVCELTSSDGYSGGVIDRLLDDLTSVFYRDNEAMESRSCLDYLRRGRKENGKYLIYVPGFDNLRRVICDFTTEPGWAWTLLMSFARKNWLIPAFLEVGLNKEYGYGIVHLDLEKYRMTLAEMRGVRDISTHVRATTNYSPNQGISTRDYVRAKISNLDPTTFLGLGTCIKVELISIRGVPGTDITVPFWQKDTIILHTDVSHGECAYDNPTPQFPYSANYFGRYGEWTRDSLGAQPMTAPRSGGSA